MLVLTRTLEEVVMIGDDIEVVVLSTHGGKVRLGIQAPSDVAVHRKEIYRAIHGEGEAGVVPKPAEDLADARRRAS
jgi:carbon storage regulator